MRRRALLLLAASPTGCSEANMLTRGFTPELLAELIRDGVAVADSNEMRAGKRLTMRITEAGWLALAQRPGHHRREDATGDVPPTHG